MSNPPNLAIPAVPPDFDQKSAPSYATAAYWDERYSKSLVPFDWYQTWGDLLPIVEPLYRGARNALNVGCGNSPMAVQMGVFFENVVNIDISPVAIDQMARKCRTLENLHWHVMDCTALKFSTSSFDCVFDKGTCDALLCDTNGIELIRKTLAEAHRVLKPNHYFFEITYAQPEMRLELFKSYTIDWTMLPPVTLENKVRNVWNWVYIFRKNS
jgi:ubiquinone/menaquinone biosynthesis C-methylase UbiE